MSLFGSIGSFLGGAVNKVVKTVTNPTKFTTAVVTGGLSVVAPKLTAPISSAVSNLYNPALVKPLLGVATRNPALLAGSFTGGSPKMGLDLGGILGTVSNIFGGNQNPIFQGISNVSSLASGFVPQATPVMSKVPQIAGPAMRGIATVGRSFFNKFPNLATAIQGYRNMGKSQVTRKRLYAMLKRFGPELLISGGILTAAAVSELIQAGPGTRRMNPGNVKALRRSLRRLESFHHLCQRADKLRRPSRRSAPKGARGTQQFVRQG
jgi:hypothetical protein